ncbi:3-isopropylmalate dehydratase [Scheffersomyces amazonensis]|uniref:3-isopropylmalate dehydratase n=1 Tax=Scheffersomyces amazonensis TaxID=1078765 RepID=UPI00315CF12A
MVQSYNLIEKILKEHVLGDSEIVPGNMVCVKVDWTAASELSWAGLYGIYNKLGKPGVFRNDRVWLAADHIVDPRINHLEKPQMLIKLAEAGAKELNIIDYQPPNTTIMHTEFYRERAQPGMLIIGADSHTCSSGALGTLAVGLGTSDVVFPLITGETYFQVPETLRINIVGKPEFGIGGKDTILHILKEFKRNTIASNRAVEYGGDGVRYLSCDARFAISNMSTEFGALAGVFVPDQQTSAFINRRNNPIYKQESLYFRPDENAKYAEIREIDLSSIVPYIALYPSPDNVVTVEEKLGMELDGCFIGACTTAEEDLILGALVLKAGLESGSVVSQKGKRKVTPGSLVLISRLKSFGLLEWYEKAGFTVGAPGCSYCVGMGADQAGAGEVWLSSQNRNFENRMGKGSFGNLASSVTVAASSFDMKLTDPRELLSKVDQEEYNRLRLYWSEPQESVMYTEPKDAPILENKKLNRLETYKEELSELPSVICSKVQRFGDDVDTDAIIPIDKMGKEDLPTSAFAYVRPEFVSKVKEGAAIIVAGRGFGSGSSRETAPEALKLCGVQAVIAKSFAYIYNRNQANISLFGIKVTDERFYEAAQEGSTVEILVKERKVQVNGVKYNFQLDALELRLQSSGGIMKRFKRDGKDVFRNLQAEVCAMSQPSSNIIDTSSSCGGANASTLAW